MANDMAKLEVIDFSPPRIGSIVPPLPTRLVTWEHFREVWRLSTVGITKVDGYAFSQGWQSIYQTAIKN